MCNFDLPYPVTMSHPVIIPFPGLFTYHVKPRELIHYFILGLPYTILFSYPGKDPIHKSECLFQININ